MRREEEDDDIARLLKKSLPSAQQEEEAGKRVFYRLRLARIENSAASTPKNDECGAPWNWRSRLSIALAAAVVASLLFMVVLTNGLWRTGEHLGVIQSSGNPIGSGESVRASSTESTILALRDGSQVEMRSQSQLQLDRVGDGLRVRLKEGSVIVMAAKQAGGHLYVETKDAIVSVVGTVFVVSVERAGSRVGVIDGVVSVQQGTISQQPISQQLLPGQQMATNPAMGPIPLNMQVLWSRSAASHVARSQESVPAPQHLAVPDPDTRPQSVPAAGGQKIPERRSAFDVVSVRSGDATPGRGGRSGAMPSGYGCGSSFLQVDPAHFSISTNVLTLVALAYGKNCVAEAKYGLIGGGPAWVTSEQFTIRATLPDGSRSFTGRQLLNGHAPELQSMLRALLADRFKLTLHGETKEQVVYALTVVKGGPKLTPFTETNCDAPPTQPQMPACGQGIVFTNLKSHFEVIARGVTLDSFAELLYHVFDRPVVNRTGISGVFDLHLDSAVDFTFYCQDAPCDSKLFGDLKDSPPLIFDAIQQQLGLKLESTKAPVERLVIDHIEKPSEN